MKDLFKLSEQLDELENLRKAVLRSLAFMAVLEVLAWAAVLAAIHFDVYLPRIAFYIPAVPLSMGFTLQFDRRRYKKKYNSLIVRQALERYFEIREFNSDYGIPYGTIKSTGMLRECNKYLANDYLSGSYKDIDFVQSDIEMRLQNSVFQKANVIMFKGRWMIFEFNKSFACDMLVYEKSFRYAKHSEGLFSGEGRLERVETENVAFNEHFKVYAQNTVEAFYLLSPQIIDKLEEIRQSIRGDLILIFHNSHLHIGVNNFRDAFEPPVFSKIDVNTVMAGIDDDIGLITALADMLRLDRKVYKN